MKKFINTFLTGVATILPLSLTMYILYKIFLFIDGITADIYREVFGIEIIGLGFFTTIAIILFVGFVTRNVIGQKLLELIDKLVAKIPVVQNIYNTIKEISKTFFNKDKTSFKQPVKIDFPTEGIESIGFITNKNVRSENKNKIAVFIPTTPNPTNGFLVFVDKEKVKPLDISIDEAIKIIISMGTIIPDKLMKIE